MYQLSIVERPRRREYSAEFKTFVLEQCRQLGASLAGITLGCGINPNMEHRWMREDRQRLELIELQTGASAFVLLQLPPSSGVGIGEDVSEGLQASGKPLNVAACTARMLPTKKFGGHPRKTPNNPHGGRHHGAASNPA